MISTPDLCDQYENQPEVGLRVLDAIFNNYGGVHQFSGQIVTIKCFEDNSVVKKLVDEPGEGRVIVMDGGGSLRRAILGDMLAAKAAENGMKQGVSKAKERIDMSGVFILCEPIAYQHWQAEFEVL